MNKILLGVFAILLAGVASAQNFVVPVLTESTGTNTPIRNAPRVYMMYLDDSQFPGITQPVQITGMRLRASATGNPTIPATWPAADISFASYQVQISQASAGLIADGEFLSSTAAFADQQAAPIVTVRSGPLTLPANSFTVMQNATNPFGPVIPFSTPYTYTPGQSMVLLVRHSGYTGVADQPFWAATSFVNGEADAISSTLSETATNANGFSSPIFFELVAAPPGLTVTATAVGNGTITPPSQSVAAGDDADFTVTANPGNRLVSVTGTTCTPADNGDGTWTAPNITAACAVTATFNQNPVAQDGTLALLEDAAATNGTLVATDDEAITYSLVDDGTLGTAVITDAATGAYTYTPDADAFGTDAFTFRANDGGGDSNTATITVTITPVNDEPGFTLGTDPTHVGGTSGAQTVPGFATFSAGPANESAQVATYTIDDVDDPDGVLTAGAVAIDASGQLTYTLSGDDGVATITVFVSDDGGTANGGDDTSDAQTFTITVATAADLQVDKDDGAASAQDGDELVYSIIVTNAGPNDVTGATLTDTLPAGLTDAAWACVPSGSTIACPGAPNDAGTGNIAVTFDLPDGAVLRYDLSATIDGVEGVTITNTATVGVPAGVTDPVPGNNTSQDQTLIVPEGIFSDGFEDVVSKLTVDAARRAKQAALRD